MVKQKLTDELTVTNYVAVPKIEHDDPMFAGLKQIVIDCWTRIFDRYTLSYTNGGYDFYDKEQCDWYAIYDQQKLAQDLRVNPRSVSRYIHKLKEAGLLIVKKAKSGANRYFPLMPKKFTKARKEAAESAPNSHMPKSTSEQMTNWQTNYFISTGLTFVNSFNAINAINTQTENNRQTQPSPTDKVQNQGHETQEQLMTERRNMIAKQRYENKLTTLKTRLGMSDDMISVMDKYSFGSLSELNMFAKALTTGKKIAKSKFSKNSSLVQSDVYKWAFMYEENTYIMDGLANKIKQVVVAARDKAHELPANNSVEFNKNRYSYILVSFANWFEEVGARFIKDWTDAPAPHMPLFPLIENENDTTSKTHTDTETRYSQPKQLSAQQQKELDELLAKID